MLAVRALTAAQIVIKNLTQKKMYKNIAKNLLKYFEIVMEKAIK